MLRAENRGLGHLYNLGARAAVDSDYVLLSNNDVAYEPDCLAELAAALDADGAAFRRRPDAARLGRRARRSTRARRSRADGCGASTCPGLHLDDAVPADSIVPTVSAHGAAMLVRRDRLLELGGFDESFFMEWEDLDLCWRAWLRGWPSVYVPQARLRHRVGGVTTQRRARAAERVVAPQPAALRAQVPAAGRGRARRRRRAAAPAAASARDRAALCARSRASWRRSRAARAQVRPRAELFEWMLAGQPA